MSINNKHEMLKFVLRMIKKEKNDVYSFCITNDEVREYVVNELKKKGYTVINAIYIKHIYVDLKSI